MPIRETPLGPSTGGGTSTSVNNKEFTPGALKPTPAQLAYEAEQARQAQLALANDPTTNSTLKVQGQEQAFQGGQAEKARAADAAKQAAAIAEAQRSQGAGIKASLTGQTQAEAAKLGLQSASDLTQRGMQTESLSSAQRLQAQAEAAAAKSQASEHAYGSATLNQQAQLQAEAEKRRQDWLKGFLGGGPSNNNGGGGFPGGTASGTEDQAISAQEDSARTAAFARAKDQAGLIGRSALSGLQNQMAGRGIGSRSGIATSQTGQVINQGATQLGDVNREQAINTAANARQRASEKLAASTTRRGQDISLINGLVNAKAY